MTTRTTTPLDLAAVRERLADGGPHFWRGLEEVAETEAFQELLHREFPSRASEWADPVTRRRFLTLMGASLALAGLGGCSQAPPEKIVPYVRQPEQLVPGRPLFFATAMALGGLATGLLVESHEGRPTKVEGNPNHPASLGATDSFAQAAVLTLYDPDRSRNVTYLGSPRGWSDAVTELRRALAEQRAKKGTGLRLLTGAVASPSLADQLERALKEYPEAKWAQYEPALGDGEADGARLAFGAEVNTYYDLEKADVILALDADFLACGGARLRHARQFAARRKVWEEGDAKKAMNRLYVVEGTPSTTGAAADHRIRLRAGQVEAYTRALVAEIRTGIGDATRVLLEGVHAGAALPDDAAKTVGPIASDLLKHRGRCVVLAGDAQPPAVHALAHALNEALSNVGQTVFHTEPIHDRPADKDVAARATRGPVALRELTEEMQSGKVDLLFVLGANPVFTAPADLDFAARMDKVKLRVHHGLYDDETARLSHWHLPEAHFLESWGDARSYDGLASVVQPLIAPLFGGRSAHEVLEFFAEGTQRSAHDIVRAFWAARRPKGAGSFEDFWRRALHDGVLEGTRRPAKKATLKAGWAKDLPAASDGGASLDRLEIVFRPDPTIHDGRFANNGWLQELPKPLSRLTWDNAAFVSPRTAQALGLTHTVGRHGGEHGETHVDVVRVTYQGRTEEFPAWVMPGHADDALTLHLGYGRTRAGRVGDTDGRHDAYKLRTSDAPWVGAGARVAQTGRTYTLACVQAHHGMEGRGLVRAATLAEYEKNPHFAEGHGHNLLLPEVPEEKRPRLGRLPLTLYGDEHQYPKHKWGMAIDLSSCVGCGACVVACQAENNIPVVGKEEVTRGREMHWLRIDRYYAGGLDAPTTYHEPVPCMHCENAPCELVCPVEATTHSHDGLNEMTYNRCVGTRYCSNNCPYKVRRFNFLPYADYATASLKLGRNPDVTVRSRGVMEKCTYCVQRIRQAEIAAERRAVAEGGEARVRDGEILTACQAACPTEAIVFGDINDPKSRVARMKATPLDYGLLTDLNTRPRTTYLAAVRNPNPEMA